MSTPTRFFIWVLLWASALLAALAWTARAGAVTPAPRSASSNSPRWRVSETSNFRIYSYGAQPLDQKVADECEAIRDQVAVGWFGADAVQTWKPKCDVVLHPNLAG